MSNRHLGHSTQQTSWPLQLYRHTDDIALLTVPLDPPTSPLGIPSWLWLTLLTFFMLFIIWLSLRNLSHLLPVRVQHAIQDFSDRLGIASHIRLLEHNVNPRSARSGNNPRADVPFGIDLDEGSSDDEDDDDELPLATRFAHQQDSSFGKSGRQQKLDRIVRLFSGGIQHARGYGPLGSSNVNYTQDEDEERVLDLPNLPSSYNYDRRKKQNASATSTTTTSPTTLFQADYQEGDASPLPSKFSLSNTRFHASGPLSPSLDRNTPRSPIRSPSLSRTPSLVAIVEETSVSPRSSTEHTRPKRTDSPVQLESSELDRSGSGSSHSQELPDWASARSTPSHAAKHYE